MKSQQVSRAIFAGSAQFEPHHFLALSHLRAVSWPAGCLPSGLIKAVAIRAAQVSRVPGRPAPIHSVLLGGANHREVMA
jgi:hypothetical protein